MRKRNALGILCFVLVLSTLAGCAGSPLTVRAQRAPGMNNAALNGNYAFTFNGMTTGGGNNSTPFAAVGRFTSDGAGNLTNGELDTNGVGPQEKLIAQTFTGTYSIGADNRGVMNLNIPGGGTLAFAMMANGNAKFVEIDAAGGHGTVGSGTMEKVDTTAYSTAKITGDYAFGVAGRDGSNNRTAIAGRLTASGAGIFSNGTADVNESGAFTTWNAYAATYNLSDSTSGRGAIILPPLVGGVPQNLNFVFYIVNAGKLFAMEMDAVTPVTPLLNGVVLQQQTPVQGFSNASLNGGMVIYLTGGSGGAGCVGGGLVTADGIGMLTLTYDQGCNGTAAAGALGTYSVASNGRAAIRVGSAYVAVYLVSSNQAFIIVPDPSVSFGFGEPQAAVPLTNSAVMGGYAGSATTAATVGVVIFSGEFTADGARPTGNISGTEDIGAPSGASLSTPVNTTYSISSSPANGRGTIGGSIEGIIYVISPSKFVVVSSGAQPSILIFER
jgi:hypothetical protein